MLLPWLILVPFIGGFLCWHSKRLDVKMPCWIALIAMGLTLVLSLQLWLQGDYSLIGSKSILQWQSEFILPWIPRFGIAIRLAIDGLSLLMVLLASLFGVLAVLCSWREVERYQNLFYMNLMWILGGVIGVLLAIDMFLFFFFWEIVLVPMFFLIALWGYKASDSKTRIVAATKFFIYTQASAMVMLIAILILVSVHYSSTGEWTFNYEDLLKIKIPYSLEYLLMLGFFFAFAVKIPIVPLHGWLLDAHTQAPTAGSVDLAGLLLKTAAYGLLRFSIPLFPNASAEFAVIAMWLGVINIFYGSWLAFTQHDIKRLIAYTSISHMGFVLIAIYTGNQQAYQGVVIQMIAHGLSTAGLFIICGQLYARLHTLDMRMMGGLWSKIKWLPAFSMFFSIAILGMPGTGNFIGEFMILFGSYKVAPIISAISIFGLVFSSIYSLSMQHRAYFGKVKSKIAAKKLPGMSLRELLIILPLIVLLVLIGFFPQPILNTSHSATNNIRQRFINPIFTTWPQYDNHSATTNCTTTTINYWINSSNCDAFHCLATQSFF